MDEFSREERLLLDALQLEDSPSALDAERVKGRVLVGAGLVAATGVAAGALEVAVGSSPFAAPAAAATMGAASTTAVAGSSVTAGTLGTAAVGTVVSGGALSGSATLGAAGASGGLGLVKTLLLAGGLSAIGGTAIYSAMEASESSDVQTVSVPDAGPAPRAVKVAPGGFEESESAQDTPDSEGERTGTLALESSIEERPSVLPNKSRALPPSDPRSTLKDEAALLSKAQAALQKGDTSSALAALEEHRTRFPRGVLSGEREAAVSVAYCKAGDSRGRERAQAFVAKYPDSPMVQRLQTACKLSVE